MAARTIMLRAALTSILSGFTLYYQGYYLEHRHAYSLANIDPPDASANV
jgi:hypothetical protein